MTPQRLLNTAIIPALAELAARGIPDTTAARRFVLAIALQESALAHRRQVVAGGAENGPAASFWQGEKGGGMILTLKHHATGKHAHALCAAYNVEATPGGVWEAIRYQDIVAAGLARLLVYTLPGKLPENAAQGWDQYVEAWRPGKPHRDRWDRNWGIATDVAYKEVEHV
jgi:hypothetical protein